MRRLLIGLAWGLFVPVLAFAVVEFPSAFGPVGGYVSLWWNGSAAVRTSATDPMPVSLGAALPAGANTLGAVNDVPFTPLALTFAPTIAGSSAALFSGGTANHNLVVFNNAASGGPTLWVNPLGTAAVAGTGIPIAPGGGGYVWPKGITTVPTGIAGTATGGTSSQTILLSGSGG